MAKKRMFDVTIVENDVFLDMPSTSQNLYFHLCMNADDYGFVGPKKIMRMIGASNDDLMVLIAKRYVLTFDSGVVVIKHWHINNTVRKDRSHDTTYQVEFESLTTNDFGAYTEKKKLEKITNSGQISAIEMRNNIDLKKSPVDNRTTRQNVENTTSLGVKNAKKPNGNQMATEIRLDKIRLDKISSYNGEKSPASEISILYYQIIKKFKLPVRNHNNVKSTIKKMEAEKVEEDNLVYLRFMLNDYQTWQHRYKPRVTEALDIYVKRNSIIDKFETNNIARGVKL